MSIPNKIFLLIDSNHLDEALSLLNNAMKKESNLELLFCKANILLLMENYGEILRVLQELETFNLDPNLEVEVSILKSLALLKMDRVIDAHSIANDSTALLDEVPIIIGSNDNEYYKKILGIITNSHYL